jgi:hypothetical protein
VPLAEEQVAVLASHTTSHGRQLAALVALLDYFSITTISKKALVFQRLFLYSGL